MTVKQALLTLLMNHRNSVLSGQQIADQLQVSRNAIWKAIEQLRQTGYMIESIPRVGYILRQATNNLDKYQIQQSLVELWQDMHINIQESVTSTNDLAKQFAIDNPRRNGLFIASHQSRGRGRHGRHFQSDLSHGLYFTLIFHPKGLPLTVIPQYTLAAASAVVQAIESLTTHSVSIKWINDLFAKGKKIGGILCEAITDLETQEVSAVLVGIGLNLAGTFTHADDATKKVAGTLFGEQMPHDFNLNLLIQHFLNQFAHYHLTFEQRTYLAYYESHLLGIGKRVTYEQQQIQYAGVIEGIDSNGHLIVRHDDGTLVTLFGHDVHFSSQQFI